MGCQSRGSSSPTVNYYLNNSIVLIALYGFSSILLNSKKGNEFLICFPDSWQTCRPDQKSKVIGLYRFF